MSGVLFYVPLARQLSPSGTILPGWTATFYISGTTTPADVYEDGDLQIPHENPVEADADGHMPPIYLDPDVTYRVQIKDANGVLVPDGDIDPIDVSRGGSSSSSASSHVEWIRVNGNDGSILGQSPGWSSASREEEGVYSLVLSENVFDGVPAISVLTMTADGAGGGGPHTAVGQSGDGLEVSIVTEDSQGAETDTSVIHVIAAGKPA